MTTNAVLGVNDIPCIQSCINAGLALLETTTVCSFAERFEANQIAKTCCVSCGGVLRNGVCASEVVGPGLPLEPGCGGRDVFRTLVGLAAFCRCSERDADPEIDIRSGIEQVQVSAAVDVGCYIGCVDAAIVANDVCMGDSDITGYTEMLSEEISVAMRGIFGTCCGQCGGTFSEIDFLLGLDDFCGIDI